MKASTFIGVSLDGFIARLNGSFDFLPEGGGEPHGCGLVKSEYEVLTARAPASGLSGRPIKKDRP